MTIDNDYRQEARIIGQAPVKAAEQFRFGLEALSEAMPEVMDRFIEALKEADR